MAATQKTDPATVELLVRRLHEAGPRADWYEALVTAGLADGADLKAAIADADAAFAGDPGGGADEDGRTLATEFDESEHPRDHGKFASSAISKADDEVNRGHRAVRGGADRRGAAATARGHAAAAHDRVRRATAGGWREARDTVLAAHGDTPEVRAVIEERRGHLMTLLSDLDDAMRDQASLVEDAGHTRAHRDDARGVVRSLHARIMDVISPHSMKQFVAKALASRPPAGPEEDEPGDIDLGDWDPETATLSTAPGRTRRRPGGPRR